MSSERVLYHALLRPAIIQILKAQGFTGAKPSVVDTITDIAAKYMVLLATSALHHSQANHEHALDGGLDLTDVRMALTDCGILQPSTIASQEVWRELSRKPIDDIPDRNNRHSAVIAHRDAQDTLDVTTFVKWFRSKAYKEILRVASLVPDPEDPEMRRPQDYLALLKKKGSKTGEGSKFQGTLLGREAEMKAVKIDGPNGTPESIEQWQERVKQKQKKLAVIKQGNEEAMRSVEMEDVG